MSERIRFFAYNELMNDAYFKEKGLEYIEKITVTLSAQRLVFNKIPTEEDAQEGLGLTNIEPTPDNSGMMEGSFYEMDERFLPKLDELFGYPKEYSRKMTPLNRHDFIIVKALVYTAQPDRIATGLKPSKAMMKLFRGAKKEMSMLYFSRLMNTRTCD